MGWDPKMFEMPPKWELPSILEERERQKRIRELEIIRGILIAVLTIIITGVVIWTLPT